MQPTVPATTPGPRGCFCHTAAMHFDSLAALTAAAGTDLGATEWLTIDQGRIDGFADATGDHQWIHVDVDAAQAGPFGGTIAHGYLTMAMCAPFLGELCTVGGISMVWRSVSCLPAGRSVTSPIVTWLRIREPTGTGLGKRTLLTP